MTNGAVTFNLGMILPAGLYQIEVSVGGFFEDDSTQKSELQNRIRTWYREVHALKELDIAEEVKKQLAGRSVGEAWHS